MSKTIYAVVYDGDAVCENLEIVKICVGREELDEYLKISVECSEIDADDGYSVYEMKRRGKINVETKVTFGDGK